MLDLDDVRWLSDQSSDERSRRALRGREFLFVRERLLEMFFGDHAEAD
jgi:hypothetical protein